MKLYKSLFFSIIFCISGTTLFSQNNHLDCSSFKKGTFHIFENGKVRDIVKRKKNIQTEFNLETGAKIKVKIVWIDDCTYKLSFLKANKKFYKSIDNDDEFIEMLKKEVVTNTIKEINGNECIYSSSLSSLPDLAMPDEVQLKVK